MNKKRKKPMKMRTGGTVVPKGMPKFADDGEVDDDEFDSPEGGADQPPTEQEYPQLPNDEALAVPQGSKSSVIGRQPTHVSQVGAMPTYQRPSAWRQIAAAGLGGLAGWMNTTAGKPGSISHPIDPSAGIAALNGMPQYQRSVANWQQRVKLAEYEDTQDEKAREADQKAQEADARNEYYKSNARALDESRTASAAQRRAQAADIQQKQSNKFEQEHVQGTNEHINLNPINQDGANAQSLPGADPTTDPNVGPPTPPQFMRPDQLNAAMNAQLPKWQQGMTRPMMGSIPVPPPALSGPGAYQPTPQSQIPPALQGTFPASSPTYRTMPQEQRAQNVAAQQAEKMVPVPPDMQEFAGGAKEVPASTFTQLVRNFNQQPKAEPELNENRALSIINAPPGKYTPDQLQQAQGFIKSFVQTHGQVAAAGAAAQQAANVGHETPLTPEQTAALNEPDPEQRMQKFYSTLDPIMKSRVERLLSGDQAITPAMLIHGGRNADPKWAAANDYAGMLDPTFSSATFDARRKTRLEYTPGAPAGRNIVSLNTLAAHASNLMADLHDLQNGDVRGLNSIKNWSNNQLGQTADPINAKTAATAVIGELSTAIKGNATDQDIKQWADSVKTNISPTQQAGLETTIAKMLYARLLQQDQAYQANVPGHHIPGVVGPQAAALFHKAGLDTGAFGLQQAGPGLREATGVPAQIAAGIAEGQTRVVNAPGGKQMKLMKQGGKLYEAQ